MATLTQNQEKQLLHAMEKFIEQEKVLNYSLFTNEYTYLFFFKSGKGTDLKNVHPVIFKILKKGYQILTDPSDENIDVYLYQ